MCCIKTTLVDNFLAILVQWQLVDTGIFLLVAQDGVVEFDFQKDGGRDDNRLCFNLWQR